MKRAFNFSAGPAALPLEVLEEAAAELFDYRGTGMSVMEMSHRSDEFVEIAQRAEADLRELLGVSDDYAVLFLQGGATAQFAAVPLNLLGDRDRCRSRQHRRVGEESHQRGQALLPCERGREFRSDQLRSGSPARRVETRSERRVRAHHRQRDDRWSRISRHSRRRIRSARIGHVEHAAVAADRRLAIRRDLCRRAEEYRAGRTGAGDRPSRPARARARRYAERAGLEAQRRQRFDVQHTGDVFLVHRRTGVPLDQTSGRPRRRWSNAIARRRRNCIGPSIPATSIDVRWCSAIAR